MFCILTFGVIEIGSVDNKDEFIFVTSLWGAWTVSDCGLRKAFYRSTRKYLTLFFYFFFFSPLKNTYGILAMDKGPASDI